MRATCQRMLWRVCSACRVCAGYHTFLSIFCMFSPEIFSKFILHIHTLIFKHCSHIFTQFYTFYTLFSHVFFTKHERSRSCTSKSQILCVKILQLRALMQLNQGREGTSTLTAAFAALMLTRGSKCSRASCNESVLQ